MRPFSSPTLNRNVDVPPIDPSASDTSYPLCPRNLATTEPLLPLAELSFNTASEPSLSSSVTAFATSLTNACTSSR